MGTPLHILVVERRTDETTGATFLFPFAAVYRSTDGETAYDNALAFTDDAMIVNGLVEGKPTNYFNGTGKFVLGLVNMLSDVGYDDYTTLVATDAYVTEDGIIDPESIEADELSLVIFVPEVSPLADEPQAVTHSGY